ncbi:MAG: MMPL family transporter [Planctomyces sp.]|nr:MMPL family transporter [Planctomyces sp.]
MATGFFKFASRPMLWAVVLTFPFLAWHSSTLRSNNETETWLPRDTQVRHDYEQFKRDFGADEVIVVGIRPDAADPRLVEAVAARLEQLPGINHCWTPDRLIRRMTDMGVTEAEARSRLEGLVIGRQNELHGILAAMSPDGVRQRVETVAQVREVLDYCQLSSPEICLTGSPVVVAELDRLGSPEASRTFFMAMLVICWALLQYSVRDVRMSLSVLGVTLWSIYVTHYALILCGGEMNFIMGALSVMVMVFTLSIAVHLLDYYTEARDRGHPDPLGHALKESIWPCLLSTVTTLLGLMSLNVSSIKPVCDFGYAAAIGAVVASVVGLMFIPALVSVWPNYRPLQPKARRGFDFYAWGAFVGRNRWLALGFGALLLGVSAYGISTLVPRLDPVDFLPRSNLVRRDLRRIEQELTGVSSIEAIVDFGVTDTPFVRRLEEVREVQEKIASHSAVRHTLSVASFFPKTLPDNPAGLAGLFARAQQGGASNGLIAQEQRLWRISVRLTDAAPSAVVCRELNELTQGAAAPVRYTGVAPMLSNAQSEIFKGFWESFSQALLTISIVMILALRSVLVGLVAMIPNLMPIALVFGSVGYAGMPVDIGMMMTGSIALGISVDCTFHFLVVHQRCVRKEGKTSVEGCQEALAHTGRPLVESTLISAIAMLALCLSSFTPTSRFGWLMASQIMSSLLGEMLFLPALLCVFAHGRRRMKEPLQGPHFATRAKNAVRKLNRAAM